MNNANKNKNQQIKATNNFCRKKLATIILKCDG